jgi:hypothetical protein
MLVMLRAGEVLPGDLVVVAPEHRKVWEVHHWPDGNVQLTWTTQDEVRTTVIDGDAALQILSG